MSLEEEYYINLHVGGKFVYDPVLRYLSGKMVRLKEDPNTISYFELCKIVKDGSTIDMINYWIKHKEIDLYVEHEINTVVFVDNDLTLAVACLQFGGDGNRGGKGVEGQDITLFKSYQ
ncbi:hypothetical protein Godav_019356 [Gossypium davidsonii]|uniref:PB1-like domain-containing protein n=1 Tax=Gossypium davidsonii TaxID=34287 RepID=A0A7J8QZI3_GOSDV|nr:hypothetical protein [Gossypium davidsonii]